MAARRIQTTLLSPLGAAPAAPAPQFAAKPLLTDVLSAKYGVPPEQQLPVSDQPPDSAFKPHTQYQSPYEDQSLKELTDKINRNKQKQGKRWRHMINRIEKREKQQPKAKSDRQTGKCKKLQPVKVKVKGHKRQTFVCLDKKPPPTPSHKKQQLKAKKSSSKANKQVQ